MSESNTITESLVSKRLQLVVHDGVNASGNARLVTKSYNNINADVEKENLHEAALALGSLYANELSNIYHSEKYLLQSVETEG